MNELTNNSIHELIDIENSEDECEVLLDNLSILLQNQKENMNRSKSSLYSSQSQHLTPSISNQNNSPFDITLKPHDKLNLNKTFPFIKNNNKIKYSLKNYSYSIDSQELINLLESNNEKSIDDKKNNTNNIYGNSQNSSFEDIPTNEYTKEKENL